MTPTPSTVAAALDRAIESFPNRDAVVDGDVRWNFAELADQIRACAAALIACDVAHGDRVAVWAPNGHRFIVAALGVLSIGAVLVPINTRYKGAEATWVLERSGAQVLFVHDGFLGNGYLSMLRGDDPSSDAHPIPSLPNVRLVVATGVTTPADTTSWSELIRSGAAVAADEVERRFAAVDGSDLSDLFFTSGTTGRPKGVMATHEQNLRVYQAWIDADLLRVGDRCLIISPMFHTFGFKAGVLACLLAGATMVPQQVFDPANALRVIRDERITLVPGPPTLYAGMLDSPARDGLDLSSLRLAVTGASVVPITLIRRALAQLFPSVVVAYGMTETCGTVSFGDPTCRSAEEIARSVGRPLDHTEVRVADADGVPVPAGTAGEIQVRGYHVMQGYYQDADATAATIDTQGWLRTGDVGVLDPDGTLRVTDRMKDMFIVGGFNVYPAEIEAVLATHPAVLECAVVGVPDPRLGEVGRAYVVARPGSPAFSAAELLEFCREHVANFKVPRSVRNLDKLPRTPSGKVQRYLLRDSARPVSG